MKLKLSKKVIIPLVACLVASVALVTVGINTKYVYAATESVYTAKDTQSNLTFQYQTYQMVDSPTDVSQTPTSYIDGNTDHWQVNFVKFNFPQYVTLRLGDTLSGNISGYFYFPLTMSCITNIVAGTGDSIAVRGTINSNSWVSSAASTVSQSWLPTIMSGYISNGDPHYVIVNDNLNFHYIWSAKEYTYDVPSFSSDHLQYELYQQYGNYYVRVNFLNYDVKPGDYLTIPINFTYSGFLYEYCEQLRAFVPDYVAQHFQVICTFSSGTPVLSLSHSNTFWEDLNAVINNNSTLQAILNKPSGGSASINIDQLVAAIKNTQYFSDYNDQKLLEYIYLNNPYLNGSVQSYFSQITDYNKIMNTLEVLSLCPDLMTGLFTRLDLQQSILASIYAGIESEKSYLESNNYRLLRILTVLTLNIDDEEFPEAYQAYSNWLDLISKAIYDSTDSIRINTSDGQAIKVYITNSGDEENYYYLTEYFDESNRYIDNETELYWDFISNNFPDLLTLDWSQQNVSGLHWFIEQVVLVWGNLGRLQFVITACLVVGLVTSVLGVINRFPSRSE